MRIVVKGFDNKEKERKAKLMAEIMALSAKLRGKDVERVSIEPYTKTSPELWFCMSIKIPKEASIYDIGGEHFDVQVIGFWIDDTMEEPRLVICGKVKERYIRNIGQLEALKNGIEQRIRVEGKEI